MTSSDLLDLGVADEIIPEPPGGAHVDWDETAMGVREALLRTLEELKSLEIEELLETRWAKYEAVGEWREEDGPSADG